MDKEAISPEMIIQTSDCVVEQVKPEVRLSIACNYCSRSICTLSNPKQPTSTKSTSPARKDDGKKKPLDKSGSNDPKKSIGPSVVSSGNPIDDPCRCSKPRARCSICLARLNTPSSLNLFRDRTKLENEFGGIKLSSYDTSLSTKTSDPVVVRNPFASFTVFCTTCRHSGHALHYLDWFKKNNNCPVSGCTCQCSSLDQMVRKDSIVHLN